VRVELAGRYTRGCTMVDWSDATGKGPRANLVLELDTERVFEMLRAALS